MRALDNAIDLTPERKRRLPSHSMVALRLLHPARSYYHRPSAEDTTVGSEPHGDSLSSRWGQM